MITLEQFEGRWRLARRIEDRRAGLTGTLDGICTWTRDAVGLVQHETGELRYGTAAPMLADRRYLWRRDGDGIAVFFEDGRPFHRLGEGHLSDRHWCDPDTYDVAYLFEGDNAFSTTWRVSGPRKDHLIHSFYTKVDA